MILLESYLSKRKIKLEKEITKEVKSGVTRGYILGPILWNLVLQSKAALRISSAYRTVSTVIAGITPIDTKVQEKTAVFNKQIPKTEAREMSIGKWQTRWNKEINGAWTRRLIPNIKPWVLRRYGETNHFISQALSDYGCFGNYLRLIGKQDTAICWYYNEEYTPKHTLFRRNRWTKYRICAENQIGKDISLMKTKLEHERQRRKAWEGNK